MNAIVTVVGRDRVGIIAAICNKLAGFNVNILDISQTILQGSFTMVMAVDVGAATASFGDLNAALEDATHILHIGQTLFFGTRPEYLRSEMGRLFLPGKEQGPC